MMLHFSRRTAKRVGAFCLSAMLLLPFSAASTLVLAETADNKDITPISQNDAAKPVVDEQNGGKTQSDTKDDTEKGGVSADSGKENADTQRSADEETKSDNAASDNTGSNKPDSDDEKNEKQPEKVTVRDSSGGFLSFLNRAFGTALKWLYDFTHSYLIAILLFALVIKIILFPLSIKQQKNSQKMAKLAPRQEIIRKKYAGRNDRSSQTKMNEEIQAMYAEEKYNPMGGCLPMLLQLPIIMVLYTVITNPLSSVYGYGKEALQKLSEVFTANVHLFPGIKASITETDAISRIANAADPAAVEAAFGSDIYSQITGFYKTFQIAPGLNLMDKPELKLSLLLLVPILVFLASFFSTKLIRKFTYNPTAGDPQTQMSNKFMDWTMPLMILWFSFSVPALVGVYWVFQNVISIGQQYLLSKMYPVKAPTPEEIREAELLMRGKKPKKAVINDDDERPAQKKPPVQKAALKKKKAKSPFIYAKKGIDPAYLARVKAKGKVPKAKMKP